MPRKQDHDEQVKQAEQVKHDEQAQHDEQVKQAEHEITDFVHAVGLLIRRLRATASTEKLSLTEAMVMARLARDGAATTADLARAEGIKPQSMRTTIATLEEMGMVERIPHPTDGRQVNIQLTAHGVSTRNSEKERKRTWLNSAILTLSSEERETLFAAGEIINRLVELEL